LSLDYVVIFKTETLDYVVLCIHTEDITVTPLDVLLTANEVTYETREWIK